MQIIGYIITKILHCNNTTKSDHLIVDCLLTIVHCCIHNFFVMKALHNIFRFILLYCLVTYHTCIHIYYKLSNNVISYMDI